MGYTARSVPQTHMGKGSKDKVRELGCVWLKGLAARWEAEPDQSFPWIRQAGNDYTMKCIGRLCGLSETTFFVLVLARDLGCVCPGAFNAATCLCEGQNSIGGMKLICPKPAAVRQAQDVRFKNLADHMLDMAWERFPHILRLMPVPNVQSLGHQFCDHMQQVHRKTQQKLGSSTECHCRAYVAQALLFFGKLCNLPLQAISQAILQTQAFCKH